MLKWFLRHVTGKCELLRITYGERDRGKRVRRIEDSLRSSGYADVRRCVCDTDFDVEEVVKRVVFLKAVVPEVHPTFDSSLRDSLLRIRANNVIFQEAEVIRKVKYDSNNDDHEKELLKLWKLYKAGAPLPGRVGAHWQDLGFQGHDPKTDFRGMGMLGLAQMIFFAETYPDAANQVLLQSHHPQYGYSFAIVAINITSMAYELLQKRKLRSHFYNMEKAEADIDDFHRVYCYLLHEFSQFWQTEKPKDIMEFSRLRDKFYKLMRQKLKSDSPLLGPVNVRL